jgi:glycosyltransferase involved in cell wall biosynthesis
MTWLPNVIDPSIVDSPAARRDTSGTSFRFLTVGNLIPVKNHSLLLRSFRSAFRGNSGVTLRIGGDGPLREELQALALQLGIADRVTFLGTLSRRDVISELDSAQAFVLSSDYETFGVVLIEALARGRPVIATSCGAPESFVTAGDGELVPVGSEPALADAMVRMRASRASYDDGDIRQRAIDRFGPAAFLEKLRPIYASVTGK